MQALTLISNQMRASTLELKNAVYQYIINQTLIIWSLRVAHNRIFSQFLAKILEFWIYLPICLNAGNASPVFEWLKNYDKFILMGAAKL